MVNWWFGARWFGIRIRRIRVPLSNNPFHEGSYRNPNHQPKPPINLPGGRGQVVCIPIFPTTPYRNLTKNGHILRGVTFSKAHHFGYPAFSFPGCISTEAQACWLVGCSGFWFSISKSTLKTSKVTVLDSWVSKLSYSLYTSKTNIIFKAQMFLIGKNIYHWHWHIKTFLSKFSENCAMAAFRTLWTCAKAVPSTADANRQSQLATIRRARMCPPELVATLWMLQICICNLRKSTSCFVGLTLQGASLALQGASRLRWQSFVVAGRKSSRSLWPGPKAAWPSTFMASKGLGAAWSWHRLWFNGLPASVEAALQKQSELTN